MAIYLVKLPRISFSIPFWKFCAGCANVLVSEWSSLRASKALTIWAIINGPISTISDGPMITAGAGKLYVIDPVFVLKHL
jgi:hypothetical protein